MKVEFVGKCLLIENGEKRILAIGDLHLGFEEALNRAGVFVSRKMFEEMIEYFDRVFEEIGKVDEIVLLGDVKHSFGNILGQEWKDVLGLFEYLKEKCEKIIVVGGNHDVLLGPIAKKANVDLKKFYIWGEVCFLHGDEKFEKANDKKIKFWILGHGHPAVKLSDGVKIEKYKCFLDGKFKGKKIVVMPSFFDYNIGSDPRENDLGLAWEFDLKNFKVWVVQEEELEVLDFGLLKKLE